MSIDGKDSMSSTPAKPRSSVRRSSSPGIASPLTIGLLRLTDAAPVVIAFEKGYFAERALDVRLSVEPSWANIADKLTYGRLNAAVMLPPLAFAVSLGLRGVGVPLIVPMSLSLNGNAVTVSRAVYQSLAPERGAGAVEIGARLRRYIASRPKPFRFAVVHVHSTHNLLLRYWLAACRIDPDKDVELSVVPPAETAVALRQGQIDGFCAGAPWGEVAARAAVGRTIVTSSQIWRNHPEKCLAVSSEWAAAESAVLDRMIDALIAAARFCDMPENADEVARILGGNRYLGLAPAIIRESLPVNPVLGQECRGEVDRSIFFANAASFPWRSHAAWFLEEMARWGHLPGRVDRAAAAEIYRPDLYRAAAERCRISAPAHDGKIEGGHPAAWQVDGRPLPIEMGADPFCDGKVFGD